MTFDEANGAIIEVVKPVFDALSASVLVAYDDSDLDTTPVGKDLSARVTIDLVNENKASLNARIGERLYRANGIVSVQIFKRRGADSKSVSDLRDSLTSAFQDARIDGIDFYDVQFGAGDNETHVTGYLMNTPFEIYRRK